MAVQPINISDNGYQMFLDDESVFAPQERAQERQAKQNALAAARQQEMQANMLRNVVAQNIDPRTGRTNWQGAMSAAPQRLLPQLQGMMGESEKAAAELAAKQATTRNTEMEVDAKYWQNQRNLAALPHTQTSWSAWRETLPEWSRQYVPEEFTPAAQQQVMRDSAAAIAEFNRQNLTANEKSLEADRAEQRGISRGQLSVAQRNAAVNEAAEARLSSNLEAPLAPKERQKREAAYPKASAAFRGTTTELDTQIKDLKALRDHPGLSGITGLVYGRTPAITGAGREASAILKTILARGGFQELAKMRANSPTGGALGNVSDTEGRYLRDSYASFDTTQDTPSFQRAIDRAIAQAESSKLNIQQAYDDTYSYRQGAAPAGDAGKPAANANTVTTPDGKVLTFPSAEAAAAFKKAAGLQ
jgi:hypothetical protein